MKYIDEIKLFATDCDGVLTDGGMYYYDDGTIGKKFNCRDGEAFKILKDNNIKIAIISGDESRALEFRNNKLKCDFLVVNSEDKAKDLEYICSKCKINLSNVLYVGDDLSDIEPMRKSGLSCCPSDAVENVKNIADCITSAKGGYGVIREITDKFYN